MSHVDSIGSTAPKSMEEIQKDMESILSNLCVRAHNAIIVLKSLGAAC